jgi:hypothetical protein
MVQKIPPPNQLTGPEWQSFNRWCLEVTGILNSQGQIDPGEVEGLPELTADVGVLQGQVATIDGEITTINTHLTTIDGEITTINTHLTTIDSEITALQANPIIRNGSGAPGAGLGSNGDLYIDNNYPGTNRLYAKIAGVWKSIV